MTVRELLEKQEGGVTAVHPESLYEAGEAIGLWDAEVLEIDGTAILIQRIEKNEYAMGGTPLHGSAVVVLPRP